MTHDVSGVAKIDTMSIKLKTTQEDLIRENIAFLGVSSGSNTKANIFQFHFKDEFNKLRLSFPFQQHFTAKFFKLKPLTF